MNSTKKDTQSKLIDCFIFGLKWKFDWTLCCGPEVLFKCTVTVTADVAKLIGPKW